MALVCVNLCDLWVHLGVHKEECNFQKAMEHLSGRIDLLRELLAATRFSSSLRASRKLPVIKTNTKSLQNTAKMRSVFYFWLSGSSPVFVSLKKNPQYIAFDAY